MGNNAKVDNISLAIKTSGFDVGKLRVSLFFGNRQSVKIYREKEVLDFDINNPLSVVDCGKIIGELLGDNCCDLYFQGVNPLQRAEWIKRLQLQMPQVSFNLLTSVPDVASLAKVLHIIDRIELLVCLDGKFEQQKTWQKFIALANIKECGLQIKIASQYSISDYNNFMAAIAKIDPKLKIWLSSEELSKPELLNYYLLASRILCNTELVW